MCKDRLRDILKKYSGNWNRRHCRVLELMAGCGRNFPVLDRYFKHITMLEQAKAMTEKWNTNIKKLVIPIQ